MVTGIDGQCRKFQDGEKRCPTESGDTMPIKHTIDHDKGLVMATAHGLLTDADIFAYQQTVWSRPEIKGFDELIDMGEVSGIEFVSGQRVSDLAQLSGSMDASDAPSKLAIVVATDHQFGLGRMYQAYREMAPQGTKVVRVFRDRAEALEWLGASGTLAG
jgi:hypothetical protein